MTGPLRSLDCSLAVFFFVEYIARLYTAKIVYDGGVKHYVRARRKMDPHTDISVRQSQIPDVD